LRFFSSFCRSCFLLALLLGALPTWAQDEDIKPVYLTARLFEVRVSKNQTNLTNQLFRLSTAAQTEDEKWLSNLKQAYPSATEVALLRTQQFRLFMRPRPGIIVLGDANFKHVEVHFLVAQGLGDDDKINTTAITEVNLYNGAKAKHPVPLALGGNGFAVEPGMTYFYTNDGLRLKPDHYTLFLREQQYSPSYETFDPYLIVALSVERDKHPTLTFDVEKSAALQSKATKKSEPQWPAVVKTGNLFGKVLVRVEINAEGQVTKANLWQSSLPEGNQAALAAAQQWEFPVSELAGINAPASALLTFALTPPRTQMPSKAAGPMKPAATKPTTKPPVKRRTK
jgi:TonB family protein